MAKKSVASKIETTRIVICIIYILLGISSVLAAWNSIVSLDFSMPVYELISTAVGVLMFASGIMGLAKVKGAVCHTCGVIIFAVSAISVALSLIQGSYNDMSLVQALLAWLFIVCI
jgi:hypothetical protein